MKKTITLSFICLFVSNLLLTAQVIPYRKGDKWGTCNADGDILVQPQFDKYASVNYARYMQVWKNGKTGLINDKGKIILKPIYESIKPGYGMHLVVNNNLKGMYTNEGKLVFAIKYQEIDYCSDGLYIYKQKGKYGIARYKDNKVTFIKKPLYDEVKYDGIYEKFTCTTKGKTIALDNQGNIANTEEELDLAISIADIGDISSDRHDRYMARLEEDKKTYRDRNNHANDIRLIKDSALFKVYYERRNRKWGVCDKNERVLVPFEYEDIDYKTSDLQDIHSEYRQMFVLKKDGKWGMIGQKNPDPVKYNDLTIHPLIDFKYDTIYCNVNCMYYIIEKDGKQGIISARNFAQIVEPKYAYIQETFFTYKGESTFKGSYEKDGIAIFYVKTTDGKVGYIREDGKEFFEN